MSGKIVCKRTNEELANRVLAVYEAAGRRPKLLKMGDGTFQVLVRGKHVQKFIPAAGVCNSHGGGVPKLIELDATLHAEIERFNETLPAFA